MSKNIIVGTEKYLLDSPSVNVNNEHWTGWFVWQAGIGKVTNQITS